jgi:hypothetical protein
LILYTNIPHCNYNYRLGIGYIHNQQPQTNKYSTMTLNATGPISLGGTDTGQSINLELGKGAQTLITLNDTEVRTLAGKPSGAITIPTDFYGKVYGNYYTVSSPTTNLNLSNLFSPKPQAAYTVTIDSGVTIGGTLGNHALTVGSFPSGSTITINNYGSIQGYGGSAPSGTGGNAICAQTTIPTVINNYGSVLAGGGGGGKGGSGGTGGAGGAGGGGYCTVSGYDVQYHYDGAPITYVINYVCCCCGNKSNASNWIWNCSCVGTFGHWSIPGSTIVGFDGKTYLMGTTDFTNNFFIHAYSIGQQYSTTTYTSGGSGGGDGTGGSGGAGGVGQGYNQCADPGSSGSPGSGGSTGSGGGTNAGSGGTGGTGGAGGAGGPGGTFGNAGASGNTGNTGATGCAGSPGNNGAGSGGNSGTGGSTGEAGGLAGYYLVKGSSSVTFNNSGTASGRLG